MSKGLRKIESRYTLHCKAWRGNVCIPQFDCEGAQLLLGFQSLERAASALPIFRLVEGVEVRKEGFQVGTASLNSSGAVGAFCWQFVSDLHVKDIDV